MWTPEQEGAHIVMIGSFNPAIFQPLWLAAQKLIRPEEAERANITTIQAELANFSTEWFELQVIPNRLMLTSTDPTHYAPLRDLAAAMFVLLPHTPIQKLGLNRSFHYKVESSAAWHGIGHLLAPKDPWLAIMEQPGLRSMTMQGFRKDGGGGILHVKIEPSGLVRPGLYIQVNEEFKHSADAQTNDARWVPGCLAEHWDAMMKYADDAAHHLLSFVKV